ncbi:histidine phosphatase superfamily [Chytriomyces sp. MP71]|nr:histidine phosphatase superfamily [Chytriomyces sp. MP71]
MTAFQASLAVKNIKNPKFAYLSNFTLPCSQAQAGLLSGQGRQDHMDLGQRIAARYPNLITNHSRISWQATNVSRVLASEHAFIAGMLKGADTQKALHVMLNAVVPRPLDADLRPFDSCTAYLNASAAQKNQTNQPDDTFNAAKYPAIASRIAQLIGVDALTVSQVKTLFDLCSFENTVQGVQAGFCSLFTAEDYRTADFSSDLRFNAVKGYALPVNNQLACSLLTTWDHNVQDMLENPRGAVTASFKFAHEETIAPIVTSLGLFQEQAGAPVLSPNMSVGDAAALRGAGEEHAVQVLVGESPQTVPGCPGVICPLSSFRAALAGKLGLCGNAVPTVGGAARFASTAVIPLGNVVAALNSAADNN